MTIAKYSHAFLVGNLNAHIQPQDLDTTIWKRQILNGEDYKSLLSDYYQSFVDSMAEAEIQKRPSFLESVCHYAIEIDTERSHKFDICLTKGKEQVPYQYKICLCKLHLYFFPNDIVLMAFEIDDSGVSLNDMSLGHGSLINLRLAKTGNDVLYEKIEPLLKLTESHSLSDLVESGNNLKIFQIVEIETKEVSDNLLFEAGSFIPVGAVGRNDVYSPSRNYFNQIIKDNSISVFCNWKALSLVDSFTVIGIDNYNKWTWANIYFPFIYLRCIFEKSFCFSRNSAYRLDKSVKNISQEITDMEKYYFYDNISYNFLPELLYDSISKGIGLKEEREEIFRQIKGQAKDKEERRNAKLLAWVSVFAVFSIAWDFCCIIKEIFGQYDEYPFFVLVILCLSVILIALLLFLIFRKNLSTGYMKKRKKGLSFRKRHILITDHNREHLQRHFSKETVGSKFYSKYHLDSFVKDIENQFPKTLSHARPEADGCYRISLTFREKIGVCSVIHIDELTDDEKTRIETIDRDGKKVRIVRTERENHTNKCQIILSKDWHLISIFPGEMAPPLPASPDIRDDYWDKHVFMETENK